MTIFQRIRFLRERLGMTQGELAAKIGYKSKSTIARIEKGERDISQDKIILFATALCVSPSYLMGWEEPASDPSNNTKEFIKGYIPVTTRGVKIPILGKIPAGTPLSAIEDIKGYISVNEMQANTGIYFALKVVGDSMTPDINSGDIILVKEQQDIDNNGQIAVILIDGEDATVKKVTKTESGLMITAINSAVFDPLFFTWEEVQSLPVTVLGVVVEIRRTL